MNKHSKTLAAAALALALAAVPLAACSQQNGDGGSSADSGAGQAVSVDVNNLKTMGDVLALTGETNAATWNDEAYLCFVDAGGTLIRALAKFSPEVGAKIDELDFLDEHYNAQLADILKDVPLEFAEDLTPKKISQSVLDEFIGKTGAELEADGFTFATYSVYGDGDVVASMEKDGLNYHVTFDASVSESQTEDGGAAIQDAKVKAAEFGGIADSMLDLDKI